MRLSTPLLAGIALIGCTTVPATRFPTPHERVTECQNLCTGLGLQMSAIVIIMNSAGCVCEPTRAGGTAPSASAASGGAIIAAAVQAQQQNQQLGH